MPPLCQHCNARFYGRQNRIACINCKLSVHTRCAGIKSDEDYQPLLSTFWCNICKSKSSNSASNIPEEDDTLTIVLEKLDIVISEVKGLKQQVTLLTAENKSLKNIVEKHCKSANNAPETGKKQSAPTFSDAVKQPVSTFSHTISNNLTCHPELGNQSRISDSQQVQWRAARGSSEQAAAPRSEIPRTDDGFIKFVSRKQKRNDRSNNNYSNTPPAIKQTNSNPHPPASRVTRPAPLIGVKTSSSLKCVDTKKLVRYRALFITRLAPETTAEEIEADLKADLSVLNDIKVSKLATRQNTYASFCIQVPLCDFPLINNTSVWPEGTLVKEFRGRMTPDKCFGYKPPPAPNSEGNNSQSSSDPVAVENGNFTSNPPASKT